MKTGSKVEFCGEEYPLEVGRDLVIGREGDLAIDDNPYLHRHFLRLHHAEGFWWLVNIGTQLAATISTEDGSMQAFLAPGAGMPLVFARTIVRFSAGSTTYELDVDIDGPAYDPPSAREPAGETTASVPVLNRDQRLLLLSLTEQILRSGDRSVSSLPTSAEAAERLGWPLTRFNRKLDYLCQKIARTGVRGLHGDGGQLAANRRFRLVEYALAARLVGTEDLPLLDELPSVAGR